ncbi:MAG: hypothetical protein ACRCXN_11685 [Bacteroidales bacterium]
MKQEIRIKERCIPSPILVYEFVKNKVFGSNLEGKEYEILSKGWKKSLKNESSIKGML